jgi:hypothetical protein
LYVHNLTYVYIGTSIRAYVLYDRIGFAGEGPRVKADMQIEQMLVSCLANASHL